MNKKISMGICISLIIIAITATFAITMVVSGRIYDSIISDISKRSQTYKSVEEINEIVVNYFYGTVEDQNNLNAALAEGYVNGLDDANSLYLNSAEYVSYASKHTTACFTIYEINSSFLFSNKTSTLSFPNFSLKSGII